jgi:hypothetical protein
VRQTDHFRAVADVPEPRRRIHSASNPGESPRTAGTVTDFGLADFVERIGSHELAGTPGYMAPEQLTRGPASKELLQLIKAAGTQLMFAAGLWLA